MIGFNSTVYNGNCIANWAYSIVFIATFCVVATQKLLENFPVVDNYSLNFDLINCKTTTGKQIATATERINQKN